MIGSSSALNVHCKYTLQGCSQPPGGSRVMCFQWNTSNHLCKLNLLLNISRMFSTNFMNLCRLFNLHLSGFCCIYMVSFCICGFVSGETAVSTKQSQTNTHGYTHSNADRKVNKQKLCFVRKKQTDDTYLSTQHDSMGTCI